MHKKIETFLWHVNERIIMIIFNYNFIYIMEIYQSNQIIIDSNHADEYRGTLSSILMNYISRKYA